MGHVHSEQQTIAERMEAAIKKPIWMTVAKSLAAVRCQAGVIVMGMGVWTTVRKGLIVKTSITLKPHAPITATRPCQPRL